MFNAIGVLVILAIAGVYVFVVKPYLKKEKKKRESYKTAEARMKASSEVDTFKQDFTPSGDPAELRVNDTLDIHGITYTVRGVVKYVEGETWSWLEFYISTARRSQRWISVEDVNGDTEVVDWQELDNCSLTPGNDTIEYDGARYELDETGTAEYTVVEGSTTDLGEGSSNTIKYYDYKSSDGRLLSFERRGQASKWEVSTGVKLDPSEFTIWNRHG